METDLVLELDYPFLHISALEDVYINSALYKCFLLTYSLPPAFLQDKKLQQGTIDGYRSAIADKLVNSTINVSKDENLTRLLDSFHRDRPKGRRGIPS